MSDPAAADRLAYRIKDFCRLSGLSRTTVYRLMAQHKLHTIRVAGRRLVPAEAARKLLAPAE